jgi:tRNA pseudouridine32 synthase/23S rRNA pseudouridine746 synthase/23S rRNA pseudouridine1911/1915/1917 synthase
MTKWGDLRKQIVIWEDECAVVVNKPPGLSVMGERHETDLVTMAASAGEPLRWVNRIDKVTSGAVVLAKTAKAHGALTRQFAKRAVDKAYLAICRPGSFPERCSIELPLMTAGNGRVRVAAERQQIRYEPTQHTWYVDPADLRGRKSYPSLTRGASLWDDGENVVVLAMPVTGRRHQIRVHLAWVGHAIVGDPLFSKKAESPAPRTYLHSLGIAFETVGSRPDCVEIKAEPGAEFWEPVIERLTPRSPNDLLEVADVAAKTIMSESAAQSKPHRG